MKKFLLCGIINLFFLIMVMAQEEDIKSYHFTLEKCIEYAFENNFSRQSLILSGESKTLSYQQSKNERLPDLNASIGENFNNSKNTSSWNGNYGINTNIPIYQGGSVRESIEQNRLQMEESNYLTEQFENDLIIQILQSFLSVSGNEELLKYQHSVVEASEEQLIHGKEQFRVGKILESDYLMLEAQYANDLNNIVDTEITLSNNLLKLKNLLSMDLSADLQIIHPDTSMMEKLGKLPTQEIVTEKALKYLPDVKISQYQVDIANSNIKLAKASYFPTINLNAGISTGHYNYSALGSQLSDKLNEQIGISINIPVFNKNRTKTKVAQNKIALRQAELDQIQTELNIRQNITQEYNNVVSSYNKYNVTGIRQNAYLKTFEAYTIQFNAGAITVVDLLQQQNNYISALNDYIQSKYSFILQRKVLDVYMGEYISI